MCRASLVISYGHSISDIRYLTSDISSWAKPKGRHPVWILPQTTGEQIMWKQLSLFDAPQLLLGDYYRAIDSGDWRGLPFVMKSIEQLKMDIPYWNEKHAFWEKEIETMKQTEKKSAVEIARFWEEMVPNLQHESLRYEAEHLERYWYSRILEKLDSGKIDYLTEKLHPAYCYLKLKKYQAAIDLVDTYCQQEKEDAFLRGCQSYCYAKMNQIGKATSIFVFAMFYDPFSLDPAHVYNREVTRLLSALEVDYPDPRRRRAVWPFECWLEGYIAIPPSKRFAAAIRKLYGGKLLENTPQEREAVQIYFNHLLYLSEIARKQSDLVDDETIALRTRMKEVNAKAFARYMERLQ